MKLLNALLQAAKECNNPVEEEGGVILHLPAIAHNKFSSPEDEYVFLKITNANAGTPVAPVLWTADRGEYAVKVIPRFASGWKQVASFHTHPSFLPFPSSIDTNQLFPGFPVNYIYSPLYKSIAAYNYHKIKKEAGQDPVEWFAAFNVAPEEDFIETTEVFDPSEYYNTTLLPYDIK